MTVFECRYGGSGTEMTGQPTGKHMPAGKPVLGLQVYYV
jgi:hypothetical protein